MALVMNEEKIIAFWPMSFSCLGEKNLITGSPNRSETRFLFRDDGGSSYIAEGYSLGKQQMQIRQNKLLEFFAGKQIKAVHPFCRTRSGEHGTEHDGLFWQIRPYIPAENVPRTAVAENPDHGFLWAEFLLQMKDSIHGSDTPPPMPNVPFYMLDFLPNLLAHAERSMPSIVGELNKIITLLTKFFKWERTAGSMFAHGDYHPGNILTAGGKIQAVIDWEFAGLKFPGYDMALLIGCLAMDDPENLSSPAVTALQNTLYRNGFMPESAWDFLPQMIAATRLGWLGEWITLNDRILVAQELALLEILLKN